MFLCSLLNIGLGKFCIDFYPLKMSLDQTHIRHDMLYEFKKGPSETEVGRNSRSAISAPGHSKDDLDSIDWKLFPSEIPLGLDAQVLSILNFRNLQKTLSKMQENSQKQFNIYNTSIIKDLYELCNVPNLGQCVPYYLPTFHINQLVAPCWSLKSRPATETWLDRLTHQ